MTICKADRQWEFAVWRKDPALCGNLEVRDGAGDGREVQEVGSRAFLWLICVAETNTIL